MFWFLPSSLPISTSTEHILNKVLDKLDEEEKKMKQPEREDFDWSDDGKTNFINAQDKFIDHLKQRLWQRDAEAKHTNDLLDKMVRARK